MVVVKKPVTGDLTEAEARRLDQQIAALAIEHVPIDSLKPNPRNSKRHPDQQIQLIAANMRQFGMTHPIVIDENNQVIGGHARIAAAKQLKRSTVPAIRLENLTAQEKRAVALADNKLAELGSWDLEILRLELEELTSTPDLEFDYDLAGFDTVEIDQMLGGDESLGKSDPADQLPAPAADESPSTQAGDLWNCGGHRLYCGDALDANSYRALLGGMPADIVFSDPPYNVRNVGHVTKRTDVREFAMASGEMSAEEYIDFLQITTSNIAHNAADGAVIYMCMDWRHLWELLAATRQDLGRPKNMIVWVKTNGGQGSFYRSQHEHIAVYVAGNATPTNNFRLGARGRYRTNVWRYTGFNAFGRDRDGALGAHPTVKPVALVVDALRDCSKRGGTVLDPFGGSGTTMIAAERTGRLARLIEIDPLYCDVTLRRWQVFSGKVAHLAETNESFDEVRARRAGANTVRE